MFKRSISCANHQLARPAEWRGDIAPSRKHNRFPVDTPKKTASTPRFDLSIGALEPDSFRVLDAKSINEKIYNNINEYIYIYKYIHITNTFIPVNVYIYIHRP